MNVHGALTWTEAWRKKNFGPKRKPTILACLLKRCGRQPSPHTITVGGSDFVVFVVKTLASRYHSGRLRLCRLCRQNPRLPLSQWAAQTLSSLSSKPSPPAITVGGSDFVVFVVKTLASRYHSGRLRLCRLCRQNPRLPLSQWAAQTLSSLSSKPSPPAITVGGSDFVVFVVKTLASRYHSGRLRLCRLCRQNPRLPLSQWAAQTLSSLSSKPSPPAITVGDSDFVVFVVETLASRYHSGRLRLCRLCRQNPRLPLSQWAAQTLSSLSSKPSPPAITVGGSGFVVFVVKTLASRYHSGWLRLCRLYPQNPRLPLSQWAAQTLSSLSSKPSPPAITVGGSDFVVFVVKTLASRYHSGRLRLCRLCRQNPRLPITVGGSDFVVFVVKTLASRYHSGGSDFVVFVVKTLASRYHSGRLRLCRLCRQNPRLPRSQWAAQTLSSLSSKPSPPAITVGGSDFVVFVVKTLASRYHSGRLRLCRLCRQNPRLPLSQWTAQTLSSLSSKPSPPAITVGGSDFVVFVVKTLASRYHSGRLRLCRLCRQNPRLPLSQWAAQALSSLSSKPSPPYHSGWLRLCCLCRQNPRLPLSQWRLRLCRLCRQNPRLPLSQWAAQALSSLSSKPSPPAITVGSSDFVVFVVEASSHSHSGKLPSAAKCCRPDLQTDHLLT